MSAFDFDLFVIGAGSGGVRAARIASAHGAKVAIAEESRVGGTCVIRGCVPKKLLVYAAQFAEDLRKAENFGWDVAQPQFQWARLRARIADEVGRLESLYQGTLERHRVQRFDCHAQLLGPHRVGLTDGREFTAERTLLASGARPVLPEIPGADLGITSNDVFELSELPKRIVVIGGGYIAMEFAGLFQAFGSKTTLVHRGSTLLRGFDQELVEKLTCIYRDRGMLLRLETQVQKLERRGEEIVVSLGDGSTLETDCVLFAIGRSPNVHNLGLETLGIKTSPSGAVVVDEEHQTNIEGVYAVGDVTSRLQLTPVAIREGQSFSDRIYGGISSPVRYDLVPSAVFSEPPLASVGMTEAAALTAGRSIQVYRSDFRPMINTLAGRAERAFYKMIVDAHSNVVLGLHLLGPDSPEILQAAAIAIQAGLTKQAFDDTVALHPSLAEELVLFR